MPKGFAYSKEELDNFLDITEEVLPISSTVWEHVAEVHSSKYPDMGWMADSLKQKFKELHNKRIPTGDPNCPPAVVWAKHLRREIVEKMDGTDLNSEAGDGLGDNKDDNADRSLGFFRGLAGSNISEAEKEDDGEIIAGVSRQASFATSASAALPSSASVALPLTALVR
jgi:hypothetical protein